MLWKRLLCAALCAAMALACGVPAMAADGAVDVVLSDKGVTVDGAAAGTDPDAAVYTAHDIVYYEAGHDFTYGEGTAADEHTAEEAQAHTVVHITQPGTYRLTGALSPGQIAVDLGKDAKKDPAAVVTLILDGVDISCTVAPAVIFYNVYECDAEGESGSAPDLSAAGAVVVLADGSENHVDGSYVARIYKSVTLNEAGTAVTDSKKLHKYDGAFYSKMSMRIEGGPEDTGVLDITAENEGLDTEMHLAINGGTVNIRSGNDGINVNEDDVSVVAVNGGAVHITVTGETGEGDGIDSNGWLVLNGGLVTAAACSTSADSGLDSAKGILLNGGTVIATGNMLDPITAGEQCCAVFSFAGRQSGGTRYSLTGETGGEVMGLTAENDFTYLVMSGPALTAGESYCLYAGQTQLQGAAGAAGMGPGMRGGPGPRMPEGGGQPPEMPEDDQPAGDPLDLPGGFGPQMPEDGAQPPEMPEDPLDMPSGEQPPEAPQGGMPGGAGQGGFGPWGQTAGEMTTQFTLAAGMNSFSGVTENSDVGA